MFGDKRTIVMLQRYFILIFTLQPHSNMAARILGVFAYPGRSNTLYTHAVMDTLSTAGHDVTVYSPYKPEAGSSFHHVHIPIRYTRLRNYEEFMTKFHGAKFGGALLRSIAYVKCDNFLGNPLVQKLLYSNETYDLVFTAAPFAEESLLVFGHLFKAPTITLLPSGTWSTVDYVTGNSLSLAFSPEYLGFPFTDRMSLQERVKNVLSGALSLLYLYLYDMPLHDALIQKHASSLNPPPPPVREMTTGVALMFINVHPSLRYSKPLPPNIVMIGGIHIKSNNQPLPKDIQEVMDNATEGVIYCSLGTILPVETMPYHILHTFIEAFKTLPYIVLWKISPNSLPDLPDNVIVSSWMPQQQIIEHPNMKLFFTHGGLGSQLEAYRVGVPVVGLPFFSDQPHNVRLYEQLGVGVGLSLEKLSVHTITNAINTVLNNRSYSDNARRVARVYADRPMEPKDLVVYWTNYILKHGGAHLRPQAAMMPWYQRYLIDVASIVIAVSIIALFIARTLIVMICQRIQSACRKKHKRQ